MAVSVKSFIFYESWYETARQLGLADKQLAEFCHAVVRYGFNGEDYAGKNTKIRACFTALKPTLEVTRSHINLAQRGISKSISVSDSISKPKKLTNQKQKQDEQDQWK